MIVKMRKYSFLVYHKIYLEFLDKIRDIGVLHVIEKASGVSENEELNQKIQLKARLKSVLRQLQKELSDDQTPAKVKPDTDGYALLEEVEGLYDSLETLYQQLQSTEREWERMEVWGKFSPDRMRQLQQAGYELGFYTCHIRKFDQEWEVLYNAFEIDTVGTNIYFVTINKPGAEISIDADPVKLSVKNAAEIALDIAAIKKAITQQKQQIVDFAVEKLSMKS